jgi:RNA methyltransferase, TrmH family
VPAVTGDERPGEPAVLSNPRAERVRAVRRLHRRSPRLAAARFVAEGPQVVREALAAHTPGRPVVLELFATAQGSARNPEIVAAAAAHGVRARIVTDDVLAAMADTVTPQGLLAVCGFVDVPLQAALAAGPRLVAILSQVRDPGNAGTVLRSADAAGAEAVVLTGASVDVHNPKCVRASAGSIFHTPVVTGVSLAEAVPALRSAGLSVYAADVAGDVDLDTLLDDAAAGRPGGIAGPVAWIFGNEAWGMPEQDRRLADAVVAVPVHGRAESLNLAAAAAVCLYATARAQRRGSGCRVVPT